VTVARAAPFQRPGNGLEQINRPLEFSQGLHRADVRSRASMALISYGKQGDALARVGLAKLMP
jgi:hypothetical protein